MPDPQRANGKAELIAEAVRRFPELSSPAESLVEEVAPDPVDAYCFFAHVFTPHVKRLLRADEAHAEELHQAFSFIETLAQQPDGGARGLVQVPFLEDIVCDPEGLIVPAAKYILPWTEAAYYELGAWIRLPPQSIAYWRGDTDDLGEERA